MTYVRGAYNAITPFYKWHTVRTMPPNGQNYITMCGLPFYTLNNAQTSKTLNNGDKCDTIACGLKDK